MQLPIRLDGASGKNLQTRIAGQIRTLILDGRLAPGARMPASRELAADLKVSRNTVMGAYARLVAEGLIEAREPAGTFVTARPLHEGPSVLPLAPSHFAAPEPRRQGRHLALRVQSHQVLPPHASELPFDFWVGRPDARLFPLRLWQSLLMRMLRGNARHLCDYGDPQGLHALRVAIATHVGATRGIATEPGRIVITNGIQEGLNLLACLLIKPGVQVAVENPCYRGAANVFINHGATLLPVRVDRDGIDPARLPEAAALVYTTPSHQYPLGATLSLPRRQALLDWARASGGIIVEDDYDSDFFYDGTPLPALKSLDRDDVVIYLGTFSKSLGAGLRIGYMVLPADLVEPSCHAKALLNNCQPWLEQAALAAFIAEGGYAQHLRRMRQSYAARRNHLCAGLAHFLPQWWVDGREGGMHVVVHLPAHEGSAGEVETLARARGVGVYGIDKGNALMLDVAADDPLRRVLLLGYAALDETEISEALLRMRRALAATPALA
ncbi:PLP-dependent aminotransferase family protein [Comamonas flocculans]|uniref:PLP-dependent aminotransferase family protein n=1 Tax=Comamonas flocculans TaxID=2597701 RepID=A0A5B8RYA2_9BURK|nr:PLP-dependent aminotransferase family protein [Comamonas flocculans]QEA14113.1 PLP-dependent aminotransferase family protein [Comamonas flocculans]